MLMLSISLCSSWRTDWALGWLISSYIYVTVNRPQPGYLGSTKPTFRICTLAKPPQLGPEWASAAKRKLFGQPTPQLGFCWVEPVQRQCYPPSTRFPVKCVLGFIYAPAGQTRDRIRDFPAVLGDGLFPRSTSQWSLRWCVGTRAGNAIGWINVRVMAAYDSKFRNIRYIVPISCCIG